jgi:hypothetical protein
MSDDILENLQSLQSGGTQEKERRGAADQAQSQVRLSELLKGLTVACTDSADQLRQTMQRPEWQAQPMYYAIPKMTVSMKVALSYSQSEIKGILWWRSQEGSNVNSMSNIEMEIVAIPRQEQ